MPYSNPGTWVTNDDYPTRAMREERQGTTSFRVTVGPDGRPTGCDITASSGSPDLDSTTCALLMRRGKFYPALDGDGNPTTGGWSSRMRWIIPEEVEYAAHPQPGQSVISFTVGIDGYPTDCLLVSGPDPAEFLPFTMPCEVDQTYPVYTDAKGNPVPRKVRMVITVGFPELKPAPRKKRR